MRLLSGNFAKAIVQLEFTSISPVIQISMNLTGEQSISDAYNPLKELLKKKFGAKSTVVTAVRELEASPKSDGRKAVLKEEVASARADSDADLLKAAQALLKAIKSKPDGEQIVQMAMGDQNIQIAGDGNVVNVNTPKTKR